MAKRCDPLPVFPADTIGPPSRAGLARVGVFGEKLVARSNPIGALFDAIRGFCSPLPQTEVAEGEFVAEGDLGTNVAVDDFGGGYLDVPTGDVGAPADDYMFPYDTIGQVYGTGGASSCGQGTVFDAALQMCVPAPSARPTVDTASAEAAAAARQALATAKTAKDCEGVRQVLDTARRNRGTNKQAPEFLRWQPIAAAARAWLDANGKRCRL